MLEEVCEEFSNEIKKENYKVGNISITIRITGKIAAESCNQVYCDHCEREAFPRVLDKYKQSLGEKCGIIELIDNWDSLPNPKNDGLSKHIDVSGCFFPNPPYDTKICPGPNYRKFLERPGEHVNSGHPETKSKTKDSKLPKRQGTEKTEFMNCLLFLFLFVKLLGQV